MFLCLRSHVGSITLHKYSVMSEAGPCLHAVAVCLCELDEHVRALLGITLLCMGMRCVHRVRNGGVGHYMCIGKT